MTPRARLIAGLLAISASASLAAGRGAGADLYHQGQWAALASDRQAEHVGDSLTVIIQENASATNTAQSASHKDARLSGTIAGGATFNESGQAQLGGSSDGTGQTGRAGHMSAQISVVVDRVLDNGDLHIAGEQLLNINGERTKIRLMGRVRRADILNGNTVLSSRVADAVIDYDGKGFVTRSGKPGLATRVFNLLGLL